MVKSTWMRSKRYLRSTGQHERDVNEKRKSPHTGTEDHDEGPRACAGELACNKEPAGFPRSGEPGGDQADRRQRREAEDTDYFKKIVERREDGRTERKNRT